VTPVSCRARVCGTPLDADPGSGTVYSDIGMMLVGFGLDRVFGRPWQLAVRDRVFLPLGMRHTRFRLPPSLRSRALPTEFMPGTTQPWQGIVHDENARWLGGVAGHAGLFATAGDLCRFARMLLRRGQGEEGPVFGRATVETFTRRADLVSGSSRCLGWDSPSDNSSGGDHLSPTSYGHTGFTGTSLWIDPGLGLAVILLTNAVHPRRECRAERSFFDWRRRVHTAVYEVLGLAGGRAL
jgi:CubicO group peptidase (beta-lactamase class C family)